MQNLRILLERIFQPRYLLRDLSRLGRIIPEIRILLLRDKVFKTTVFCFQVKATSLGPHNGPGES